MNENYFYHTVTHRKCNKCGFKGQDIEFKQETVITQQGPNWACMTTTIHCPGCNSDNLSGHFHDQELTNPVKEPDIIKV